MNMNNKRAEQVHYIPPGRRKPAVSAAALATVVPPLRSSPKTAIPPLPSLYQPTTTSTSRPAVDSPTLNHVQPAPRFEPSTTPPIRATETMRSSQTTPHGRIQPQRRDSYEVGVTPAMAPGSVHHSRDPVRLEHAHEHKNVRSDDRFYRGRNPLYESPRIAVNSPSAKYGSPLPPMARHPSILEERYGEMSQQTRRPSKTGNQVWADDFGKSNPVAPQPVIRILRNPDRERERERENREFTEEHVSRTFIMPSRPEHPDRVRPYPKVPTSSTAQFLGDNIHSLTPSTTLQDRCRKFINSLHPERPDPPAEDEPYEYPYCAPCDPATLPLPKHARKIVLERTTPAPNLDHDYFTLPANVKQTEKRRRPRHRSGRARDYEETSSTEECNRRLYRLHT